MNAAMKIQRFLDEGRDPEQVRILVALARALGKGKTFDVSRLYAIDMNYFRVALDLLAEWRLGQHIHSRACALEQLQMKGSKARAEVRNRA